MKKTIYKRFVLGLVTSFVIQLSWGQHLPDSLVSYLEIAAKNNPTVLQKFYEYQAAMQKVPQVGGLPDPELSAGIFLKPMELVSGKQVADLRLMQMFPWFGVLKSAKDEMSLMAKAKFELFRDTKLQVYYDVQSKWYELYKIRADITISKKNIEILKTIQRLALVRFQSLPQSGASVITGNTVNNNPVSQKSTAKSAPGMQGMGGVMNNNILANPMQSAQNSQSSMTDSNSGMSGLVDLYRIQIETGDLENYISTLKSRDNTIVAMFNGYLNRSPQTPVFTEATLQADTVSYSLTTISDSILKNNPMLRMLEFEKQSLEAREKMVRNMGFPMVGLGLNYSFMSKNEMLASSMNGKDMIMPMVSVTLPIYRKKYNAKITEAVLLKEATINSYTASINSLQAELYQAIQQYQDAVRSVRLYNNQFDLASRSLDIILKSFTASTATLTDLLRIRQQTFDYELKRTEAMADLNTTTALLNRLIASSYLN